MDGKSYATAGTVWIFAIAATGLAIYLCHSGLLVYVLIPLPSLVGIVYHLLNLSPSFSSRRSVVDAYRSFAEKFDAQWSGSDGVNKISNEDLADDTASYEPKLSDTQVRKAILGLLDVDLLAAVGAGSDNTVTLAQAQIRSPSDPGYEPTAPPAMTTPAALALLTASGYQIESTSASPVPPPPSATPPASTGPPEVIRGRISKDGQQLSLVIGVAANDPTAVAVANTAADQLRNVGIAATVLALDPVTLYRDALNNNQVDAIVGWHQAGGNLATLLASRYGCPALQSTPQYGAAPATEVSTRQ